MSQNIKALIIFLTTVFLLLSGLAGVYIAVEQYNCFNIKISKEVGAAIGALLVLVGFPLLCCGIMKFTMGMYRLIDVEYREDYKKYKGLGGVGIGPPIDFI